MIATTTPIGAPVGSTPLLTLATTLGLDPHLFVHTIAGGPLASPYAVAKGNMSIVNQFYSGPSIKGIIV